MSVVWGLLPENVPAILSQFGNVSAVVNKIINPQVTSICMLEGSELGAKQFIEGESREDFQNSFTKKLKDVCAEKKANVQICLVRDIEIPRNIQGSNSKGLYQCRVEAYKRRSKKYTED